MPADTDYKQFRRKCKKTKVMNKNKQYSDLKMSGFEIPYCSYSNR